MVHGLCANLAHRVGVQQSSACLSLTQWTRLGPILSLRGYASVALGVLCPFRPIMPAGQLRYHGGVVSIPARGGSGPSGLTGGGISLYQYSAATLPRRAPCPSVCWRPCPSRGLRDSRAWSLPTGQGTCDPSDCALSVWSLLNQASSTDPMPVFRPPYGVLP